MRKHDKVITSVDGFQKVKEYRLHFIKRLCMYIKYEMYIYDTKYLFYIYLIYDNEYINAIL